LAGTGKLSPEIYKSRLSELETEKEHLEEELANLSGAYAAGKRALQADADRVAEALESGSVLVEYVGYRTCNFRAKKIDEKWGAERYLTFVLPAGQNAKPTLIDLGEAKIIDQAVYASFIQNY
jgi:hypothetical protein